MPPTRMVVPVSGDEMDPELHCGCTGEVHCEWLQAHLEEARAEIARLREENERLEQVRDSAVAELSIAEDRLKDYGAEMQRMQKKIERLKQFSRAERAVIEAAKVAYYEGKYDPLNKAVAALEGEKDA